MAGNERKIEIKCPWCQKKQIIKSIPNNMIMAFNCKFCDEPIVVIQDRPIKIDKSVLESGEILKLQEYLLDILEKEFNIIAEINEIEQIDGSEVTDENNNIEEEKKNVTPISQEEIMQMKNFLDQYKIPRNGEMFDEEE